MSNNSRRSHDDNNSMQTNFGNSKCETKQCDQNKNRLISPGNKPQCFGFHYIELFH